MQVIRTNLTHRQTTGHGKCKPILGSANVTFAHLAGKNQLAWNSQQMREQTISREISALIQIDAKDLNMHGMISR